MAIRSAASLADIRRLAERRRRTVTVYAPALPADLPLHLGESNVELGHVPVDVDREVVVVADGEETTAVVHLEDVLAFTDAPTHEEPSPGRETRYREFLTALADTPFSSLDRRHLLAATREFEDRAFRAGDGRLLAGFQSLSRFRDQLSTYRRLGSLGLEVHVFGAPDWAPPFVDNLVVHPNDSTEIVETWFVVFDGDGEDDQKCALLADEVEDGTFSGIWTYDPTLVDTVVGYLEREYSV